jgi:hypothetical protein
LAGPILGVSELVYDAQISRSNPACIVILVDQSESMQDGIKGDPSKRKCDGVAEVVNRFLHSLVIRCTVGMGEVFPYYFISVIGYGSTVGPAFVGKYQGTESVCISDLAEAARVDTRTIQRPEGEERIKTKVWFDPIANGRTPMCQAFQQAQGVVDKFVAQYPNCYPPMVMNITDGDSTDGNPSANAESIKQIQSTNGNALVFNVHVSSTNAPSTIFPNGENSLGDPYAKMLFRMSSTLPAKMRQISKELRFEIADGAKGFAFNADLTCLTSLLEIGTRGQNTAKI